MNSIILLIPHYENPSGLYKSLKSIDSDETIDVVIVDDGSKQHKIDEAVSNQAFSAKGQIFYQYLTENKGIEFALNKGLEIVKEKKYDFVARLDCGDICLGKRFAMQKIFLESHPEIKIVGTNVIAVDTEENFLYKITMPEKHREIKHKMFYNSMLIHPTVMFSTEVLSTIGFYPTNFKRAEDYAFFFEIIKRYQSANMNQYLCQIEINTEGISISKRKEQVQNRINIIKHHFYFGFYPVYGLLRNYVLLYLPYQIIFSIKKIKSWI